MLSEDYYTPVEVAGKPVYACLSCTKHGLNFQKARIGRKSDLCDICPEKPLSVSSIGLAFRLWNIMSRELAYMNRFKR